MRAFPIVIIIFLRLHLCAYSQNVGINATGSAPNSSAALDIDFSNKGILIPRIVLTSSTDAVTIISPATSLMVYNTGGALTAGYYYNSGTAGSPSWISFTTSATNDCLTNCQAFTSNGTFTVPAGVTKIKVIVIGGGAGGGGGGANGLAGGGGGAGGYAEGIFTVVPATNYAVTIGGGGTGGTAGGGGAGNSGNNGGNSSFGALISATGGQGGLVNHTGGIGGLGSNGYLNSSLGNGGQGGNSTFFPFGLNGTGDGGSGGGGASGAGYGGGGGGKGGGNGSYSNAVAGGNALANTGAGGGGGMGSTSSGINSNGGNGAAGKVIVFW